MIVPTTSICLILTTVASREEADRIAAALVDGRLAACVNILPGASSVYRWQEKVETADEILLIIKTTADKLDALETTLRQLHSYELPEFLVLHPESASQAYAAWLAAAVHS